MIFRRYKSPAAEPEMIQSVEPIDFELAQIGEIGLLSEVSMKPEASSDGDNSLSPLKINGHPFTTYLIVYETDSPDQLEEAMKLVDGRPEINIPQIRNVPNGEYSIKTRTILFGGEEKLSEPKLDRIVKVFEGEKGKVIHPESLKDGLLNTTINPGTESLMRDLGYVISSEGAIEGTPIPETLIRSAADLGLAIEFHEGGKLSAEEYVETFSRGAYPVATGNEYWYSHDINDDHITAMVLGGAELMHLLQRGASKAIETHTEDKASGAIDQFTNCLGGFLYVRKGQLNAGYDGLIENGEKLGISKEEVDHLVINARAKAQDYDIELLEEAKNFQP